MKPQSNPFPVILVLLVAGAMSAPSKTFFDQGEFEGRDAPDQSAMDPPSGMSDAEWNKRMYHPEGMTRREWLENRGFEQSTWKRIREKTKRMNTMSQMMMADDPGHVNTTGISDEVLDGDIILTERQLDVILKKMEDNAGKKRTKRKAVDFEHFFTSKWTLPVHYKFDGSHKPVEQSKIRTGIKSIVENTCVRFVEMRMGASSPSSHLIFTNHGRCASLVGATGHAQTISLSGQCVKRPASITHEIGHSLGFWHEQQRSGRDDSVTVDLKNTNAAFNFALRTTMNYGIEYDYDSAMHYPGNAFSKNGGLTIRSKDPMFQKNMGQRTSLSFLDFKGLNFLYCNDTCKNAPLPKSCENGGYQDPVDCSRCKCPDGWGGRLCQDLASPKKAKCGGELTATSTVQHVKSPNYDQSFPKNVYEVGTECSWRITAKPGARVVWGLTGDFGLYCYSDVSCYHWLEVRYKKSHVYQGPRFCGYKTPREVLKSEGNSLLVVFRSNYDIWPDYRRGFKFWYKSETDPDYKLPKTVKEPTKPVVDVAIGPKISRHTSHFRKGGFRTFILDNVKVKHDKGVASSFDAFFVNTKAVRLQIWRAEGAGSKREYRLIGEKRVVPSGNMVKQTVVFRPDQRFEVKKGDVVGFTNEEETSPVAYHFSTSGRIYQRLVGAKFPQINNVLGFSGLHFPFEFMVSLHYLTAEGR